MSFLGPAPEQSTSAETALLAILNALPVTPSGYAIVKTGVNPSTFASIQLGSSSTVISFNDADFFIYDNLDSSKKMVFDLSAIGSGATSTITVPNVTGTMTVLGNSTTGTGSIVRATSPALTLPTIADSTDSTKKIAFTVSGNTTGITVTLAAQNATSQTMSLPITRQAETIAIKPQVAQSSPGNPTGTTDTTGKMMGLAGAITPQVTGRICIQVSGDIANNTLLSGAKVQLRTGTGTAPANADALTGTTAGGLVQYTAAVAAENSPFALQAIVSGLTLGTAVWIDTGLAAVTSGTATIKDLSLTVFEL